MKGMAICKVCGRDFALMAEEHYVVCDPKKIGSIATLVDTDKAYEYDAFDCPHCGCQYVAQPRKSVVNPCEVCEGGDENYEADYTGCSNCKYDNCNENEEPCNSCSHCDVNSDKSFYIPKED